MALKCFLNSNCSIFSRFWKQLMNLLLKRKFKHASLAIKKGIERQLETVMFFSDDDSTKQDLSCVPLTNSCAESNFGKLNCALSQTSGSYVSLGPVSNKNILQSNPSETSLSSTEKKASLVWVRRSPEAKEYKLLVKEYQQKVKNSQAYQQKVYQATAAHFFIPKKRCLCTVSHVQKSLIRRGWPLLRFFLQI